LHLKLPNGRGEGGGGLFAYSEEKNDVAKTPFDYVCSQMRSLNESLDEALNTLSHTKESLSTKTLPYGHGHGQYDDDTEFPVSLRLAQEKIYQLEKTISQMTPQKKQKELKIDPEKYHSESKKSYFPNILKLSFLFGITLLYFSLSYYLDKNKMEINLNEYINLGHNNFFKDVDSTISYEKAIQIPTDKPKGYPKIMNTSDSNNITRFQRNLTGVHINMINYIEHVIFSMKTISFFVKSQIFNRIRFDLRKPKMTIRSSYELVVNKNNQKTTFIDIFILAFKRFFSRLNAAKHDHNYIPSTDLTLEQINKKSGLPGVHINMLNFIGNFAKSFNNFFFFIKTQILKRLKNFRQLNQ
jgi:hypothetical protein